jgi:hypothetical protein
LLSCCMERWKGYSFYGAADNGNVVDPGELARLMNMLLIQM